METFYLGIVIFLFILAIFDLVVGVSNDAVNFLNSAIGAKSSVDSAFVFSYSSFVLTKRNSSFSAVYASSLDSALLSKY